MLFSRFIFIMILLCLSIQIKAQKDYSIIHFMCISTNVVPIYLNDRNITGLANYEQLDYKIFSEGRIKVTILQNGIIPRNIFLDIENGKDYYVIMDIGFGVMYKEISEESSQKFLKQMKNIISLEEDTNKPVGDKKIDSGPKQGTCFALSQKGLLLTNYHVISERASIKVSGIGGDFSVEFGAKVIAVDIYLDLALLQVTSSLVKFDSIPFGFKVDPLKSGSKAFVLGYPFTNTMGNEVKVTDGIISSNSGIGGSVSHYQLSVPVQPGNSGSPLIDDKGNIIGIINSKHKDAEAASYALKSSFLETFLIATDNRIELEDKTNTKELSNLVESLSPYIYVIKAE